MRNFRRNFGGGGDVSDEDASGMIPDTPVVPEEGSNDRNPETPVDVPDEMTTATPADIPQDEFTTIEADLFNITEDLGTNEKLEAITNMRECWRRRDEN